ncbi:GNAT family N-acetyltransferase [Szabonella alba]|uniref:N-acetyltransferase n=1 Tax=Szabonella alba TaxID=2804194 RepID=A0A8K0Y1K6_9RHOB|nr:GNAT family N-acetyltransferase [Szabonella alba]MBL4918961.1 N-acetyltransferase [Szabonella alba]
MTDPANADSAIRKELSGAKGRYVLTENGAEAEITFSVTSATLIIADHTGVPEALRGSGAGLRLVEYMVTDARASGFRIMPLCPFVNAMRKRHPEWADAFAV